MSAPPAPLRAPLAVMIVALLAGGCGSRPMPPAAPRATLSADSPALLAEALRRARPAYATQEVALRSGAYRQAPAELLHVASPAAAESQAAAHGWVIQIAAFPERAQAEAAAAGARRHFPGQQVVIEVVGPLFRVVYAGWSTATAARSDLEAIRRVYPDAWDRARGVS